jgi:hypothetical protein
VTRRVRRSRKRYAWLRRFRVRMSGAGHKSWACSALASVRAKREAGLFSEGAHDAAGKGQRNSSLGPPTWRSRGTRDNKRAWPMVTLAAGSLGRQAGRAFLARRNVHMLVGPMFQAGSGRRLHPSSSTSITRGYFRELGEPRPLPNLASPLWLLVRLRHAHSVPGDAISLSLGSRCATCKPSLSLSVLGAVVLGMGI